MDSRLGLVQALRRTSVSLGATARPSVAHELRRSVESASGLPWPAERPSGIDHWEGLAQLGCSPPPRSVGPERVAYLPPPRVATPVAAPHGGGAAHCAPTPVGNSERESFRQRWRPAETVLARNLRALFCALILQPCGRVWVCAPVGPAGADTKRQVPGWAGSTALCRPLAAAQIVSVRHGAFWN